LGLHSEYLQSATGFAQLQKQILGREIGLTVDGIVMSFYHVFLVYTEMDARLFVLGDLAYSG
jgi:hypothetical protein